MYEDFKIIMTYIKVHIKQIIMQKSNLYATPHFKRSQESDLILHLRSVRVFCVCCVNWMGADYQNACVVIVRTEL